MTHVQRTLDRHYHLTFLSNLTLSNCDFLSKDWKSPHRTAFWQSIALRVFWAFLTVCQIGKMSKKCHFLGSKNSLKNRVFGPQKVSIFGSLPGPSWEIFRAGGGVSNCYMTPCVDGFGPMTQLMLLIYCLVYRPQKVGFLTLFRGGVCHILTIWTPQNCQKVRFWSLPNLGFEQSQSVKKARPFWQRVMRRRSLRQEIESCR